MGVRPMTGGQARILASIAERAGPVHCRHCGTSTAVASVSESPFGNDEIRVVYVCHGKRDFRTIDTGVSMHVSGEVFHALIQPVFEPPSWFVSAANDRRRSIPEVRR